VLVLSRKPREQIVVGDAIRITIMELRGQEVWIGIEAPAELAIICEERTARPDEPKAENQQNE
jgi:carbon storage regulator